MRGEGYALSADQKEATMRQHAERTVRAIMTVPGL
jgi:hypothetical protein